MLITPHVLTGITIANKIDSLPLAAFISVISHQILDLIPHDEIVKEENLSFFKNGRFRITLSILFVIFDTLVALAFTIYFAFHFNDPTRYFLCGGLAIWSDVLRIPYIFFNAKGRFFKFIDNLEGGIFHTQESGFWGIAVQISIVVDTLAIIFNALQRA